MEKIKKQIEALERIASNTALSEFARAAAKEKVSTLKEELKKLESIKEEGDKPTAKETAEIKKQEKAADKVIDKAEKEIKEIKKEEKEEKKAEATEKKEEKKRRQIKVKKARRKIKVKKAQVKSSKKVVKPVHVKRAKVTGKKLVKKHRISERERIAIKAHENAAKEKLRQVSSRPVAHPLHRDTGKRKQVTVKKADLKKYPKYIREANKNHTGDIKRDAGRLALPCGVRYSRKGWANGERKKGTEGKNRYYEYRSGHCDKSAKYKLEEGGQLPPLTKKQKAVKYIKDLMNVNTWTDPNTKYERTQRAIDHSLTVLHNLLMNQHIILPHLVHYEDGGAASQPNTIVLPKAIINQIEESVKMGYNRVVEGWVTKKKMGLMLVNDKDEVRGVYPIEMKEVLNEIVANPNAKYEEGGELIHVYKLGDKFNDAFPREFDTEGMFNMADTVEVSWGVDKIEQLFESFQDLNIRDESAILESAIKLLKAGNKEGAEIKLNEFKKLIKEEEIKKIKFHSKDENNNNIYKGEDGTIYVDVEGVIHEATEEGEPLYAVYAVEIVEDFKDGGIANRLLTKSNYKEIIEKQADDNFSKAEIKNIIAFVDKYSDNLSGKYGVESSGGNTFHIYIQLQNSTWLGFHNASGDVTLSKEFKTLDDLMEATWSDYESVFGNEIGTIHEEGDEYSGGGAIDSKAIESLKGKTLEIYSAGVTEPIYTEIKEVRITPSHYTHRHVFLKTGSGYEETIPLEKINDFINHEEIITRDSKGEHYAISLAKESSNSDEAEDKLKNFDLNNLDFYEKRLYDDFRESMSKERAIQMLINNVEGDYSQLSPELAKIAEIQNPTEYAAGGSLDKLWNFTDHGVSSFRKLIDANVYDAKYKSIENAVKFNRVKYNRMYEPEQKEYEQKMNKQKVLYNLRYAGGNDISTAVTKEVYDYANIPEIEEKSFYHKFADGGSLEFDYMDVPEDLADKKRSIADMININFLLFKLGYDINYYNPLNFSTKNGIKYFIALGTNTRGKIHTIAVSALMPYNASDEEANKIVTKEDLKEMSESAKQHGADVDKIVLYTNRGVELHSKHDKPKDFGFDKIIKVIMPFKHREGGELKNNIETIKQPLKDEWSYTHNIGVIDVQTWGKPFLVLSENKYWDGESWGYNYYKLGVTLDSNEAAQEMAKKLRLKYNLSTSPEMPNFYDSANSQALLLKIAEDFPNSEIKKKISSEFRRGGEVEYKDIAQRQIDDEPLRLKYEQTQEECHIKVNQAYGDFIRGTEQTQLEFNTALDLLLKKHFNVSTGSLHGSSIYWNYNSPTGRRTNEVIILSPNYYGEKESKKPFKSQLHPSIILFGGKASPQRQDIKLDLNDTPSDVLKTILKHKDHIVKYTDRDILVTNKLKGGGGMGDVIWASDGGYYTKPEHKIIVTRAEADEIKNITDQLYRSLFSFPDLSVKITPEEKREGSLKYEILKKLMDSGIELNHDNNEGGNYYYWINNKVDMNVAKEEFKSIVDELYDKVVG